MKDDFIIQHKLEHAFAAFHTNIAIEYKSTQITYNELALTTERMAKSLLNRFGLNKGKVGILMNDRVKYIQITIALLRCGYTIVPLYPGYPIQRLILMITSIGLERIVIDDNNIGKFADLRICDSLQVIVNEKHILDDGECYATDKQPMDFFQDDPAYIHFTSGTTGKPKAILGRNKGLAHYLTWLYSTFDIGTGSRVPQFSIQGFDPFLKETLGTLLNGATICVPEDMGILRDAYELSAWINDLRITHVHCVSSLFRLLNNATLYSGDFADLKYILLAGEKIEPADLKKWYRIFDERITLVNCYGPTETTMSKLFYVIKKEDVTLTRIPVGKPMDGAQALIMDESLNLCGPMVPGEIYIRTPYRSLGYCNDPEQTKAKFVSNPFRDDPDDLLYKSGDYGRYLTDGNVEILGRVDRQIKLNGYRIELEEIEGTIAEACDDVKEAVVIDFEKNSSTHLLYAFITLCSDVDEEKVIKKVKEHLKQKMPSHVNISSFRVLDEIPRNDRLKIDYEKLKKYKLITNASFVKPQTAVQKRLAEIWSRILVIDVDDIGIDDGFLQLGGNSLGIMNLVSEIYSDMKVRVTLGAILKNDTIRKQEIVINTQPKGLANMNNLRYQRQEVYDLSYPQEGIWVLSKLSSQATYNIPFKIELKGTFDIVAAEKAINRIAKRHSALRTTFFEDNSTPKQKINQEINFKFDRVDLRESPAGERMAQADHIIETEVDKQFDLGGERLFYGIVFHIDQNRYLLFMNFYHFIFDGYSINLFASEFARFYNSYLCGDDCTEVDDNIVQYGDFVMNERSKMLNGQFDANRDYWKARLEEPIEPILFNGGIDTSSELLNEADYLPFVLDVSLRDKIMATTQKYGCTEYMILLSGFFALLYKLTYQEDIVIGMPVNGRTEEEYRSVIGFFVNTIPIRIHFSEIETFGDLFLEVRDQCTKGYENYYPFDKLVSELNPTRSADHVPIISTIFLFHDNPIKIKLENLEFDVKEFLVRNAKHDIKLDMQLSKDFLTGRFEYRKHKFSVKMIENLRDDYLKLLDYICEDGSRKVDGIFGRVKNANETEATRLV